MTETIIEGDYSKAPNIKATWFIDPPYHVNGRPQQRGMGYAEECNSASLNYAKLAEWCRMRKGQKIVCEQEGRLGSSFSHLRHARNSIGNAAAEVVWVDRSPAQARHDLQPGLVPNVAGLLVPAHRPRQSR